MTPSQRRRERNKKSNSASRVTSSSNRGARGRSGAARAAKKTTSSGRGAGRTPTVDSRKQRQKASNAKVTNSGGRTRSSGGSQKITQSRSNPATGRSGPSRADAANWKRMNESAKTSGKGPVKGAPGTSGANTNAKPVSRSAAGKNASTRMRRVLQKSAAARAAAKGAAARAAVGKAGIRGAAAAAGIQAYNTADGTLKGKPTGPKQGPPAPKAKPTGYAKGSFNDAFKRARNAKKKTFTWKGKKYAVKLAS